MEYSVKYCSLKDHLGSTRMVLDENGAVKQALMYQPYGTVSDVVEMGATATDPLRQKFTTKEFDEEGDANSAPGIQAYYFGRRYFISELGCWGSIDPKVQYLNSYLFCSNNPILMVDPDGCWSFKHFFSTFAAEIIRPLVEMGRAIKERDAGKFFKNAFFGLTPTGAMVLNLTEASAVATWAVLPDLQNKMAKWGWIEGESGAHGDKWGGYESYLKAQKKNAKSNNPFTRWEAKGRIAHTTQDRKHHSDPNSSVIKGPWHMILSDKLFKVYEDVAPIPQVLGVPEFPFINTLRVWEGASDYYEELYGYDLGF